jgi:hypothetical protein
VSVAADRLHSRLRRKGQLREGVRARRRALRGSLPLRRRGSAPAAGNTAAGNTAAGNTAARNTAARNTAAASTLRPVAVTSRMRYRGRPAIRASRSPAPLRLPPAPRRPTATRAARTAAPVRSPQGRWAVLREPDDPRRSPREGERTVSALPHALSRRDRRDRRTAGARRSEPTAQARQNEPTARRRRDVPTDDCARPRPRA